MAPSQLQSQVQQTSPLLAAETSDVRPFARLLRGIGLKHNAVMAVSESGFEVAVEDARSLSATAWIPATLFDDFSYRDEEAEVFELSLDALLLCLNIFGNAGGGGPSGGAVGMGTSSIGTGSSNGSRRNKRRWAGEGDGDPDEDEWRPTRGRQDKRTGMRMTWMGKGHPLCILLRDDAKGPVTTCELNTLEPEELVNQPFDDDARALYLIMKSEWFRDALVDLPQSCSRVTMRAMPARAANGHNGVAGTTSRTGKKGEGSFSIYAEGDFGTVQFDYPNDREVMESFQCASELTFSYHAAHITTLGRALQHAMKICLQIEASGFLSVQVMMPIPPDLPAEMHKGILEFKMNALDEDEEEEEE